MTPKFPRQAVPGRLRQENQQSEVIFSHAVGLRAAWTTFYPVSKNNRKTDSKKTFSAHPTKEYYLQVPRSTWETGIVAQASHL